MAKNKGFTIIEVITVVAIISVLAAVVWVNLSSFRNKARDASIKANMSSLVFVAGGYYTEHGSYDPGGEDNFCNDPATENIFHAITSSEKPCCCWRDADVWVACVQLSNPNNAWCVDNTGIKNEISWETCEKDKFVASWRSCTPVIVVTSSDEYQFVTSSDEYTEDKKLKGGEIK